MSLNKIPKHLLIELDIDCLSSSDNNLYIVTDVKTNLLPDWFSHPTFC